MLEYEGLVQPLVPLDDDPFLEENEIGNHVLGMNSYAIGVCCISKHGVYTWKQIESLKDLCALLLKKYSALSPASFLGHYETDTGKAQGKTCPGFDMMHLRKTLQERIAL